MADDKIVIDLSKYVVYYIHKYSHNYSYIITSLERITKHNAEALLDPTEGHSVLVEDALCNETLFNTLTFTRNIEYDLYGIEFKTAWIRRRHYKHTDTKPHLLADRPLYYFFKNIGRDHPFNKKDLYMLYLNAK